MIPMPVMRLDKLIANAGLATRSETKRIIREGRVTVNGVTVRDPAMHCDTDHDVRLDGVRALWQQYVYLMMHKPAGYLSVTEDPKQPTVLQLLPDAYRHVNLFPAGRLDKDSEGLLLLTSDGAFCHRVISPKSGIVKEYYIRVGRPFPPDAEALFARGAVLEDGEVCLPAELIPQGDRTEAIVRISEGKYHQVKRMAIAAGVRVSYLKRLAIGSLRLPPDLEIGKCRELSSEEAMRILGN